MSKWKEKRKSIWETLKEHSLIDTPAKALFYCLLLRAGRIDSSLFNEEKKEALRKLYKLEYSCL